MPPVVISLVKAIVPLLSGVVKILFAVVVPNLIIVCPVSQTISESIVIPYKNVLVPVNV